jgi:hypothetical protein
LRTAAFAGSAASPAQSSQPTVAVCLSAVVAAHPAAGGVVTVIVSFVVASFVAAGAEGGVNPLPLCYL